MGCVAAGSATVEGLEPFFKLAFKGVFFQFLVDFGRFWDANLERKIDF